METFAVFAVIVLLLMFIAQTHVLRLQGDYGDSAAVFIDAIARAPRVRQPCIKMLGGGVLVLSGARARPVTSVHGTLRAAASELVYKMRCQSPPLVVHGVEYSTVLSLLMPSSPAAHAGGAAAAAPASPAMRRAHSC